MSKQVHTHNRTSPTNKMKHKLTHKNINLKKKREKRENKQTNNKQNHKLFAVPSDKPCIDEAYTTGYFGGAGVGGWLLTWPCPL